MVRGSPSFHGRQQQYRTKAAVLFTSIRDATGQGRQSAGGGGAGPRFFTSCGDAVSRMNPQLWPSAPTPEKSLHWPREG